METVTDSELLIRHLELTSQLEQLQARQRRIATDTTTPEDIVSIIRYPRTQQNWATLENLLMESIATVEQVMIERNLK